MPAALFLKPSRLLAQQRTQRPRPPSPDDILRYLPRAQVNPFSTEIVLNSRYSLHGGYSGPLSNQVLANVLWAAGQAPVIGSSREVYVALPDNVYVYDPAYHGLRFHKKGNHLSEGSLAFEVGIAGQLEEDAGSCLHYAQLAGVAFWTTKNNQPCCCVKDSGRSNANNTWSPASTVHMVCCFGHAGSVNGINGTLVAISSDGSLPDPSTNGTVLSERLAPGDVHQSKGPSVGGLHVGRTNRHHQRAWHTLQPLSPGGFLHGYGR